MYLAVVNKTECFGYKSEWKKCVATNLKEG